MAGFSIGPWVTLILVIAFFAIPSIVGLVTSSWLWFFVAMLVESLIFVMYGKISDNRRFGLSWYNVR